MTAATRWPETHATRGLVATPHALASDAVYNFYVLSADGNRDRKVDSSDLNVLAANFGTANRTFAQGNFDYGTDGLVSSIDFNVLAAHFGRSIAAAPTLLPATRPQSYRKEFPEIRLDALI